MKAETLEALEQFVSATESALVFALTEPGGMNRSEAAKVGQAAKVLKDCLQEEDLD